MTNEKDKDDERRREKGEGRKEKGDEGRKEKSAKKRVADFKLGKINRQY